MHAFARSIGAAVVGADAVLVDVQVAASDESETGERHFRIVGLPDSALREGRERIRGAILHSGYGWAPGWTTVNLAPATARKEGAALDLTIALAVLDARGLVGGKDPGPEQRKPPKSVLARWLCLGELTLDGRVRGVRGVLAAALQAREKKIRGAIVPLENAEEAAAVGGLEVVGVRTLTQAVQHLSGARPQPTVTGEGWTPEAWGGAQPIPVRGQPVALRAAWVSAAGGHNLLLSGPPGAGKTLLARHLANVLSPLARDEAIEVSRIHSVAGLLSGGLARSRPYRAPHHSTSLAGLIGGGSIPRPGEVALAHLGVLFLDELAEFPRPTLEALRQPLEDGHLTLGRAAGRARFPSEFVLVAATNPCWFVAQVRSPTEGHAAAGWGASGRCPRPR